MIDSERFKGLSRTDPDVCKQVEALRLAQGARQLAERLLREPTPRAHLVEPALTR